MSEYENYLKAERVINEGLIRLGVSLARPEGYVRSPERRMDAMRRFLADCGDPQAGIPAVHVAGTSGKGSVSAAVAGALREAGLSVGLHISPYLQSATEKIWIDDRFVSGDEFADLVGWVEPIARPWLTPDTPASIHGMASVAIAMEAFRRARVDVIVFEAGCGARYDLTSFVDTRTAVITNVGMDHVVSLGPSLEDIAWHKAGVARPEAPLITGAGGPALEVIREEARRVGCELIEVDPSLVGWEQNRRVAEVAARTTAGLLGRTLDDETMASGLCRTRLAARTEEMPGDGATVVLDGAHNAEKLSVAVNSALAIGSEGRRVAVLGFLGTKANAQLVRPLAGRFDLAVATEPRVYGKTANPATDTAALLREAGVETLVEPDPLAAIELAADRAGHDGLVLVAGSFYLAGELRERWFSKREVVLGRTSWPRGHGDQPGQTLSK